MKLKHPRGLYLLALTELCERFCFWGVGNLLVLYLVQYYQFANSKATYVLGVFTGCASFIPPLGGWIADRWNYSHPIYLGCILSAIGAFLITTGQDSLLYVALAFVLLGYGLFTPSSFTLLGRMYHTLPQLRDAGFSIYYASINIGVFLSLLICGYIGQTSSWSVAFAVMGIVQLLGLIPFALLPTEVRNPEKLIAPSPHPTSSAHHLQKKVGRDRLLVVFAIYLISFVFWVAWMQGISSMSLFGLNFTDRNVGHFIIPSSWLLSLESLFIVVFAPLMGLFYAYAHRHRPGFSSLSKSLLSLVVLGGCYILMFFATDRIPHGATRALVSPLYLVGAYLLMAISELLLAPISLAAVTKLSPPNLTGLLVGLWYLFVGLAFYFGGLLASLMDSFPTLKHFFGFFVLLCFIPACFLFFFVKPLERMKHGIDQ